MLSGLSMVAVRLSDMPPGRPAPRSRSVSSEWERSGQGHATFSIAPPFMNAVDDF